MGGSGDDGGKQMKRERVGKSDACEAWLIERLHEDLSA